MNPFTRYWMPHRKAYTPSIWPSLVVGVALSLLVAWLLQSPLAGVAGAAVGAALGNVRWAIWRRRHPMMSPEEYAQEILRARREAAPWN